MHPDGAFFAGWDLKFAAMLEGKNPLGELELPEDGGARPPASDRQI